MENYINCKCGSNEFITKPNQYDVYQIIDSNLEFQNSEFIDDKEHIYCRDCGKILKPNSKLKTSKKNL